MTHSGTLFICGTPIGNLDDVSFRLLETLKSVDLIAAEDTRQTKKLLDRYQIHKPLTSYHKFNLNQRTKELIDLLKQGKNIALVSDAGMPGISDPGYQIIRESALYQSKLGTGSVNQGIRIIPIPGPSAFLLALAISGLPTDRFIFEGFLPHSPQKRRKVLRKLIDEERTLVFYESPHRILKTLEDIKNILGDRPICVARELTKKFEEVLRGKISEIMGLVKPLGEFTVVVGGRDEGREDERTSDRPSSLDTRHSTL